MSADAWRMGRAGAAVITAVVIGLAAPAAAATDAPTATQLVKQLVHEGVCTRLQVVDGAGHEVKCRTNVHFRLPIRVTAYAAHGRLLKAIQHEIDETCALAHQLPNNGAASSFPLVVGATWFATAEPVFDKKIAKRLGGKVKTYTCASSRPSSSLPVD